MPANCALKIALNTDTPIAPPMDRKNVTAEVAVPSSDGATAFCTASTSTCVTSPRPDPSRNMDSHAIGSGVSGANRDSSSIATVITAVPTIGKIL